MADYLSGSMSAQERAHWEQRVLEDPDLSEALYGDLNVAAALDAIGTRRSPQGAAGAPSRDGRGAGTEDAGPGARTRRQGSRMPRARPRRYRIRRLALAAVPVAAVLAAVVLIPRLGDRRTPESGPLFRGEEGAVRLLRPLGEPSGPPHVFQWTRDPEADRYRFEIFDAEAHPVFQTVTRDTFLILPELPLVVAPEAAALWRVVPLTASGSERPAPAPARFGLDAD
jgi:hypothetical protein